MVSGDCAVLALHALQRQRQKAHHVVPRVDEEQLVRVLLGDDPSPVAELQLAAFGVSAWLRHALEPLKTTWQRLYENSNALLSNVKL